jgi:hypothetical protein
MAAKNVWNIFTSGHSCVDDSHSEYGLQQTASFRVLAQGRDQIWMKVMDTNAV